MTALDSLFSTTRLFTFRAVGAKHGSVVLVTVEARREDVAQVEARQQANDALPWNDELRITLEALDDHFDHPTVEVVWRSPLDRFDVEAVRAQIVERCTPKERVR